MSITGKTKLQTTNNYDKIHILHVDDDPSNLEISTEILTELNTNFEINDACCVDEGFSKLAVENYDVVVSDYEMPQKDGLQFLKELRERKNEIPFILFTGKGREEIAIKAINLGASGYFNKQGTPETVYGELTNGIVNSVEKARLFFDLKQKYTIIESISESVGAGLTIIGKDYRIIWANKHIRERGGEVGKLCYSTCNGLSEVCPNCGARRIFEEALTLDSHDYTYMDSKGKVFWTQIIVTAIKDEHGNVVAALELAISLTERKNTEEKLRIANLFIRSLKQPEELNLIC